MSPSKFFSTKERVYQFYKRTEQLSNEFFDENDDEWLAKACAVCPYAEACTEYKLHWGCSAWEDSMGEDL